MKVSFDSKNFVKEMNNVIKYTEGFLEGAQMGKSKFLVTLGEKTKEILEQYVDSNARINPEMLHHVYEWYQTGSPEARLFDIDYTISNLGLSFKSSFRQSTQIKAGSKEPFYNKAKIMENGVGVTIKPKSSNVLRFEVDGKVVYTPNAVRVNNPGGKDTDRGFEEIFDSFFTRYFSQAFLNSSGLLSHFSNPIAYKRDLPKGKRGGKSAGITSGYRWVANMEIN